MKVILVGHPGSQHIVRASKFLVKKYLPFEATYLNYEGPIEGWAKFVADHLEGLKDDLVIFALDDYLLSAPLDEELFAQGIQRFDAKKVACVKMCKSTGEEHRGYPVTTQYTIWRRQFLIWLLRQVGTPWEFEIRGSEIFRATKNVSVCYAGMLDYPVHSCLSKRWEGVRTEGNKNEDIEFLKKQGYL